MNRRRSESDRPKPNTPSPIEIPPKEDKVEDLWDSIEIPPKRDEESRDPLPKPPKEDSSSESSKEDSP